ncbi:hypothetical protein FJ414_28295 [Mesorhizobium sp. B3-1-6]|uniref:hypothetical protein n=1 Tax=Mesorhizobium sp. B3-1-6 TaxID=2589895 RepID=UPI00112B8B2C|nr:hypothetical protein [Mesorhizobium sp. B3-1-6]TPI27887.1 hypothetical protein FJ414_28295 [Mesorhizobium sp. B3-1-6]
MRSAPLSLSGCFGAHRVVVALMGSLLLSSPASSANEGARDQCAAAAFFANCIMRGRQSGASLEDVRSYADKELARFGAPPAAKAYYRSIVSEAFRHPRYSKKAAQSEAMKEFSDFVFADCIKLLGR